MPSDLEGLLERVKAARGADGWLDGAIGAAFADVLLPARAHASQHGFVVTASGAPPDHGCGTYNPTPLYTASVDAALGLVGKMLPNSFERIARFKSDCWQVNIGFANRQKGVLVYGPTRPLAILAALLSALIEQRKAEPKQGEG